MFFDIFNIWIINLPISNDEFKGLVFDLFAIQSSISTLGIALLALLTESIKDKKYGVRIGHFLMSHHHPFLKHQSIIILLIFILLLNYLFLSFNFLNSSVTLFLVSLLLIIFLTYDVLKLFTNIEKVSDELKENLIFKIIDSEEEALKNIFSDLNNHLVELAYENKILELQENIKIYPEIYDNTNLSATNRLLVENYFEEVFKRISYLSSHDVNEILYEIILNMYKIGNNNKIYVDFDNRLRIQLFDVFSSLPQKYYYKERDFPYISLYELIVINEQFNTNKKQLYNESRTELYISYVYYNLFKVVDWDENFLQTRKRGFFDVLYADLLENNRIKEIFLYTIILLENKESGIWENKFLSRVEYDENSNKKPFLLYNISVIIYCYYLLKENDESIIDSEYKKIIEDLFIENKDIISQYLEGLIVEELDLINLIKDTSNLLEKHEKFPSNTTGGFSMKTMIMRNVIQNFFISFLLNTSQNSSDLINHLMIVKSDISIIYNEAIDKKTNFIEHYKVFTNYFMDSIFHSEEEAYRILIDSINKVYVNIMLEESFEIDAQKQFDNLRKIAEYGKNEVNKKLDIISSDNKFKNKTTKLLELPWIAAIDFFEYIDLQKRTIIDRFEVYILNAFLEELRNSIIKVQASYSDEEKLKKLYDEVEKHNYNFNTIVTQRNLYLFYNDPLLEFHKSTIKNYNSLEVKGMNSSIMFLNANHINTSIGNFDIEFHQLSQNEIFSNKQKVRELYRFNNRMSNRSFLFTEDELTQLYNNRYRKIKFTLEIDFEYSEELKVIFFTVQR